MSLSCPGTVQRVKGLGGQIGITRYLTVINKTTEPGIVEVKLKEMGVPAIGTISYDKNLSETALSGKAPIDVGGPAVESIKEIKEKLVKIIEETPKQEGSITPGQ